MSDGSVPSAQTSASERPPNSVLVVASTPSVVGRNLAATASQPG